MTTTHYVWDRAADNCLMEKDGDLATIGVFTTSPLKFGDLISQRRGTSSFFHYDGQMSARDITDDSQ